MWALAHELWGGAQFSPRLGVSGHAFAHTLRDVQPPTGHRRSEPGVQNRTGVTCPAVPWGGGLRDRWKQIDLSFLAHRAARACPRLR